MRLYKIEALVVIEGIVLAVYHSTAKSYQFAIIDEFCSVFDDSGIFYTSEAAERKGREMVEELLRL